MRRMMQSLKWSGVYLAPVALRRRSVGSGILVFAASEFSRNYLQQLIEDGCVTVNRRVVCKTSGVSRLETEFGSACVGRP